MKKQFFFLSTFLFLMSFAFSAMAQKGYDLAESKDYKINFNAKKLLKGDYEKISGDFEVKIISDKVEVDLPLKGNKEAVNFKSKDFNYTFQKRKSGGANVQISFIDQSEYKQIFLKIEDDLSVEMTLIPSNGDPIMYKGKATAK